MGWRGRRGTNDVSSHAILVGALGDVEVEEDLAHRHAATEQVEEAREKHPADILDSVVEVD